MIPTDDVKQTVLAIRKTFLDQHSKLESRDVEEWITSGTGLLRAFKDVPPEKLHTLVEEALEEQEIRKQAPITDKDLARWYEMSLSKFERIRDKSRLDPAVLVRHRYLEQQFKEWLEAWGYAPVDIGRRFEGLNDVSFVADVHGIRRSLHGNFDIIILFSCDDPPNEERLEAMFESIEAFTAVDRKFGRRDILMLVTPFDFSQEFHNRVTLQNKQEPYTVVTLEEEQMIKLLNTDSDEERFEYIAEKVEREFEESEKGPEDLRQTIEVATKAERSEF